MRWRTLAIEWGVLPNPPSGQADDRGETQVEGREELFDALEFDLTRLDSDEDTLATVSSGRVVLVWREPDKPNVHPRDCGWLARKPPMWTVLQ